MVQINFSILYYDTLYKNLLALASSERPLYLSQIFVAIAPKFYQ